MPDIRPGDRDSRHIFRAAERLVIKIGGALLVDPEGTVRQDWLDGLAADLADIAARGTQVCVVASGAMAAGRAATRRLAESRLTETDKRLCAALGQARISAALLEAGRKAGCPPALVLLERADFEDPDRAARLSALIDLAWSEGALPVLNQHDATVGPATEFRDNDHLAACAADLTEADLAIYLTGTDGLYRDFDTPGVTPTRVPVLRRGDADLLAHASDTPGSEVSGGGMAGKILSAFDAAASGAHALIVDGTVHRPLGRLGEQSCGTLILAE